MIINMMMMMMMTLAAVVVFIVVVMMQIKNDEMTVASLTLGSANTRNASYVTRGWRGICAKLNYHPQDVSR